MPYLQRLVVIKITADDVDVGSFPSDDSRFGVGNVADEANDNIGRVACKLSKEFKLFTPVSICYCQYTRIFVLPVPERHR